MLRTHESSKAARKNPSSASYHEAQENRKRFHFQIKAVSKKVLLHPEILKCKAFNLCLAVISSTGTFVWKLSY